MHLSTFTKQQFIFWAGLLLPLLTQAQNNIVLTSPASDSPGTGNVLVGNLAGKSGMYGLYNTVTGFLAGSSLTSGSQNTLIGTGAGRTIGNGFYGLPSWLRFYRIG